MSIVVTPVAEPAAPAAPAAPISQPATAAQAPAPAPAPPPSAEGVAPAVAALPTQQGPKGILFDFNDGCRVVVPEAEHPWRIRLSDLDTGNILFETELKTGRVNSTKRYYVRFRLEVWQQGESVLVHEYSVAGRDVLVRFPVDTLGDPLGWFPYAVKFKERHGCRLTCSMSAKMCALLRDSYPDITFLTEREVTPERFYASYTIAVFYQANVIYDHKDCVPSDFRRVGLHRAAGYILGVNPTEEPPRIVVPNDTRPLAEPYVCIAVQSTLQAKYWNNPTGWAEIVQFLKQQGYRVVCIDLKPTHGKDLIWTHMPTGAEDQTGDKPLIERARWLKHADFFIGLSSGLSWLAWAMRTPVVLISGVTHPTNEFATPYRVINYHACNSCWNDPLAPFDRGDFLSCPRHKNTPRQFECSRLITADQVKQTIRRIPGFGARRPANAGVAETVCAAAVSVTRAPYRGLFINLDRSTDRLADMQEQFEKFNLTKRYFRFSAVDGQTMGKTPGSLKPGEFACFRSHYLALEGAKAHGATIHLMEDDVDVVPEIEHYVTTLEQRGALDPYDLIFTDSGITWDPLRLRKYCELFDQAVKTQPAAVSVLEFSNDYVWGLDSYLVPAHAVGKVAAALKRGLDAGPDLPNDIFVRQEARAGRLRLGLIFPFITGLRVNTVGRSTHGNRSVPVSTISTDIVAQLRQCFFLGRDLRQLSPTVLERLGITGEFDRDRLIAAVLDFVFRSKDFSPF